MSGLVAGALLRWLRFEARETGPPVEQVPSWLRAPLTLGEDIWIAPRRGARDIAPHRGPDEPVPSADRQS